LQWARRRLLRLLGGSSHCRGGGNGLGGLLGLDGRGSLNLDGLGGLLGGGLLSLGGLGGLRDSRGLLSLLLGLLRLLALALALDGGTELGERRGRLGLGLALTIRGGLVLLAESEGQRALALLILSLLLGLTVSGGSDLDSLSGDSGGRRDLSGEGLSSLNSGDHRSGLSDGLGGGGSLLSRSRLGSGCLLLAEGEVAEDAGTLDGGRLSLDRLLLLLLSLGLLGGGSLGNRGSLEDGLGSRLSSGSLGDGNSGSLSNRGLGLSGLGLSLNRLLLLLLAKESTEDGSTLAASRAALGSGGLLLKLLLLGLLGSSLSSGGLSSSDLLSGSRGLGGLSSGLSSRGRSLLLLLRRGGGLEALKGLLVSLRLDDGGGKLLGLSDLQLKLGNPVVTLGSVGSLESVLVALRGEVELVGTVNDGLGSLRLF